jgi:hypothetical protein
MQRPGRETGAFCHFDLAALPRYEHAAGSYERAWGRHDFRCGRSCYRFRWLWVISLRWRSCCACRCAQGPSGKPEAMGYGDLIGRVSRHGRCAHFVVRAVAAGPPQLAASFIFRRAHYRKVGTRRF